MTKRIDGYFYKTFFTLLGVVAAQSLIVFSVNLADSIMLGSYSEVAMSGVSLANQIQFLLQCMINGVCNGHVVIASQYWGEGKTEPIKKVFAAALWTGVALSAILAAAVMITPSGVLGILSDETEIVAAGAGYISIIAHSYIIFAVSNLLVALMRSIESVKVGFVTSAIALVVNIVLNFLLIFGKAGFPELGAEGAAWATLISRVVELSAVLIYVLFIDKKLKIKIRDFFKVQKSYFGDFLKSGLPLIGSGSSWGIAMAVQTAIIGRLGAAAIGANAVAAPIFQVVSVIYSSSSSAASVLIGKTVGEGDYGKVKKYAKKLQLIFLGVGLVSSFCMFILRNPILSFYDISPETEKLALTFINVYIITIVGSAYEAPALCGIVSGGGDTKFVLINDLIFMWGIVLPCSFLSAFVFAWPIPVTFFILKADQILKCFVAIVKVNRFKWIKKLTRA